jgi:hypothetical protein
MREGFERFVLVLPAVTLVHQWRDDSVAKVGGKIFALYDRDGGEIWLKFPTWRSTSCPSSITFARRPISPAPNGWRLRRKLRSARTIWQPT